MISQLVHRSMKDDSGVANRLYIKRGCLLLEDWLFFSLYWFSWIAHNSTTSEIKDILSLSLSLDTHFEISLATSTSCAPDPARYRNIQYYLSERNSQLPIGECHTSWRRFHFRPENWDLPSRSSEHSSRKTDFNRSLKHHLAPRRFNTICLGKILNIRPEDAILCGNVSASGRRIRFRLG
jgi:hypothetical protein